ncbi:TIM44-like domain-containing protein [Clostridium cibarium]|uniref:TIM44-like domain-containing protein n=1 Tax=Clostridium cibarium TaxID=2762247 RepID=A0ABR8PRC9_9CLOT|nr:TIM44-like domain-containing protein [Clostridium cibarium]MBD7910717.1 TIM44-like domain-containing protein [Clostridium cibarium]
MKVKKKLKFLFPLLFCILLQLSIIYFFRIDNSILSRSFQKVDEEQNNWSEDSNIGNLISWTIIIFLAGGELVIYKACIDNDIEEKVKLIEDSEEYFCDWNYVDIEDRTEEIFYKIQEAWTKRNIDIAKDYISESIYNEYKKEIDYMKKEHSINILSKIRLITTRSVGMIKYNYKKDYMWFYIEASMIDYKISDITGEIVEGDTNRKRIFEYWKVALVGEEWVLDERLLKEEVDQRKFLSMVSQN